MRRLVRAGSLVLGAVAAVAAFPLDAAAAIISTVPEIDGSMLPVAIGLVAAGVLTPILALVILSLLSAALVRSSALESAMQQAELLEQANNHYSLIVQRVEEAHYQVNKMVPPTPDTVPLSIPATFLHDVGERLHRDSKTGIQVRQYSDYPFPWRTSGGPHDDFEREACLVLDPGKELLAVRSRAAGFRRNQPRLFDFSQPQLVRAHFQRVDGAAHRGFGEAAIRRQPLTEANDPGEGIDDPELTGPPRNRYQKPTIVRT